MTAPQSRCFNVDAKFSSTKAACYQIQCSSSMNLSVEVSGKWYNCPPSGGKITMSGNYHAINSITCPPAYKICVYQNASINASEIIRYNGYDAWLFFNNSSISFWILFALSSITFVVIVSVLSLCVLEITLIVRNF